MKKINAPLSLIALAIGLSFSAQAEVRINGFANFTAGLTTEDTLVYGQGDEVDFSNASLFALQVSSDVTDNLNATAQIVAKGNNDFNAEFEWAYLSYNINDQSTLSAGRFRLPVFRYSASLDVGYSYHWIAAPAAVYNVAFNNINGLRYDYTNYIEDFEYLFQVSLGNFKEDIGGGTNNGKNVLLTSVEGTYNSFKGRLVYGRGDNVFESPALDNGISSFISQISAAVGGSENVPATIFNLVDKLELNDDEGIFIGAGLEFDNFDWFVSAEWTQVEIEDSFNPTDTAFYITAGKRLGKWTPHVTYQARDGMGEVKFANAVAQIPEPLRAPSAQFNQSIQALFFEDYTIATVGVRYDAFTNVALKAEVSKYDNKIEPSINSDNPVDTTLLNLSVQFIF